MNNSIKMRIISNFIQKKPYFESKNNNISINLNQSNNYCSYSQNQIFLEISYGNISPYTNSQKS